MLNRRSEHGLTCPVAHRCILRALSRDLIAQSISRTLVSVIFAFVCSLLQLFVVRGDRTSLAM